MSRPGWMGGRTVVAAAVGAMLVGVAAWLWLRMPPRAARLLPEADAIVYLNLAPLRRLAGLDSPPVARSSSYQDFIDRTGIVAERDLDRAAFALTRREDPNGPDGPVAFSYVLEGRFDSGRLARALHTLAASEESYAGRTVYSIPSAGRMVRVAIMDAGSVAVSNTPTTEQIHAILDHARIWWASGPQVLAELYPAVPATAPVWAVGRLGLPFRAPGSSGTIEAFGVELPLLADSLFVASLRAHSAEQPVRLAIEQRNATEAEALASAQSLNALLNLLRTLEVTRLPVAATPSDAAMRELVGSVKIEVHGTRTVLTADADAATLRHLRPNH